MKPCDHTDKCESCHEAMRKLKVVAAVKNELRSELAEKLGVSGMKGQLQLDKALARVEQLLLIERIAIAAEREGLMTASELEGSSPALRA